MTDGTESWTEIADDGFIGLIGPIFSRPFKDGSQYFRLLTEKKHKNRGGFVHGGMLMSFADRAMGTTARGHDATRAQSTVQFSIQFIRAVRIGDLVEIKCSVLRQTRSLVFMTSELRVGGEIVASATGVWKIIRA